MVRGSNMLVCGIYTVFTLLVFCALVRSEDEHSKSKPELKQRLIDILSRFFENVDLKLLGGNAKTPENAPLNCPKGIKGKRCGNLKSTGREVGHWNPEDEPIAPRRRYAGFQSPQLPGPVNYSGPGRYQEYSGSYPVYPGPQRYPGSYLVYPGPQGYPENYPASPVPQEYPGSYPNNPGPQGYPAYPGSQGYPARRPAYPEPQRYPGSYQVYPGPQGYPENYPASPVPQGYPGSYPTNPGPQGYSAYPGSQGYPAQSPAYPGPQGYSGSYPTNPGPQGYPGSYPTYSRHQGYPANYPAYPGSQGYPAQSPAYPGPQGYTGSYPASPGPQGYSGSYPSYPGRHGYTGSHPAYSKSQGYPGNYPAYPGPQYSGHNTEVEYTDEPNPEDQGSNPDNADNDNQGDTDSRGNPNVPTLPGTGSPKIHTGVAAPLSHGQQEPGAFPGQPTSGSFNNQNDDNSENSSPEPIQAINERPSPPNSKSPPIPSLPSNSYNPNEFPTLPGTATPLSHGQQEYPGAFPGQPTPGSFNKQNDAGNSSPEPRQAINERPSPPVPSHSSNSYNPNEYPTLPGTGSPKKYPGMATPLSHGQQEYPGALSGQPTRGSFNKKNDVNSGNSSPEPRQAKSNNVPARSDSKPRPTPYRPSYSNNVNHFYKNLLYNRQQRMPNQIGR